MNKKVKGVVAAKEFTLFVVLVLMVIVFTLINKNFLSLDNVKTILNSAFTVGTFAVGISCLLICGKLDLSTASTGMLSGVLIALLLQGGMPWFPALLIVFCFGAVTGLINAFFVNVMNFTPFISTLGVSTVYGGLGHVLTNSQNIQIGNQSFYSIASANLFGIIPLPFFIMIILLVVYGIILSQTRLGRRIYMTGGNTNAMRLAGINPKRITTGLFINNSVIAAFVGAMMASRMHMGSPSAMSGKDLDAITAAILGGVAYTGGTGNMFGVLLGIMLLSGFENGLLVVGLDSYYRIVAKGVLLIAALALDYYRERSRQNALHAAADNS